MPELAALRCWIPRAGRRRLLACSLVLGGALVLVPASPALAQAGPEDTPAAEASAEPAADLSQGVPVESEPEVQAEQVQPEEPSEPEAPQEEEEEAPPPASAEPGADLSQGEPPEEATPPEPGGAPSAEAAVTVDGQGSMVTRPFGLHGGEYAVNWSAQTTSPECTHNATLHAADDGRPVQPLGGGQVFGGAASGQTSLHDLPGATYYVDAISTCRWSITISPTP
jgi:hypothetical protein